MDYKFEKELIGNTEKVIEQIIEKKFVKPSYPKKFDVDDYVILGLYDGIVSRFDSIIYLAEADKVFGVESIARAILEAHAFLIYIIERDTLKRAKAYFYSVKKKEVGIYKDLIREDEKGNNIRKYLKVSKMDLVDRYSAKSNELEKKYEKYVGVKKKNWYQYDRKNNNFSELCESLGLGEKHYLLFKMFSTEVHAKDAGKQFEIDKSNDEIGLIYMTLKNIEHVINYGALTIVEVTRLVYKYYGLESEKSKFNKNIEFKYKSIKSRMSY